MTTRFLSNYLRPMQALSLMSLLAVGCTATVEEGPQGACSPEDEDCEDGGPEAFGTQKQALNIPMPTTWLSGANCTYGTYGCNKCVPDVEARFDTAASGSSDLRHQFYFNPTTRSLNGDIPDTFHVEDHIQSVARIPGSAYERWIALTRNARDKGDAAFALVPFDQISSHGDAWKWAYRRTTSNPTATTYNYYRLPGFNHAGGAQALGPMLFVAADCDAGLYCTAAVKIYDVRNPARATLISTLALDGSRGELKSGDVTFSSRAAAVGAARLRNGQTLLMIRGRESEQNVWFFRSDTTTITSATKWIYVSPWIASNTDEPWHAWENVNLVTDCNTGGIYVIAMGTSDNKSYLYKLSGLTFNGFYDLLFLDYMDARGLNTSGPLTSTRFGGGVHITPNGNIVSYVTDRSPEVEIEEFRYHGTHGD